MHANIKRLEARRTRRALQFSDVQLSADQLYDLVLAETESEEAAKQAWRARRHAELRAGITPT